MRRKELPTYYTKTCIPLYMYVLMNSEVRVVETITYLSRVNFTHKYTGFTHFRENKSHYGPNSPINGLLLPLRCGTI